MASILPENIEDYIPYPGPRVFPDSVIDTDGKVNATDGQSLLLGKKQWIYKLDFHSTGPGPSNPSLSRPGRFELKQELGTSPGGGGGGGTTSNNRFKNGFMTSSKEVPGTEGGLPVNNVSYDFNFNDPKVDKLEDKP